MNLIPPSIKRYLGLLGLVLAGLSMTGCKNLAYVEPEVDPAVAAAAPLATPATPTPVAVAATPDLAVRPPVAVATPPVPPAVSPANPVASSSLLRAGDNVTVTFSDLPLPLPDHKERIREDGKITMHLNVTVQAAGKTPGQLQEDIRKEYVPKYFTRLTVTVKTDERVYYVGGEVRAPGRQQFLGDMTVLRAIDTVGGFTDFANRKKVELRRSNGQKIIVNWHKAVEDPKLDLPVFPNDQIIVHKKLF